MDAAAVGAWATVVLAVGTSVSVIFLARQVRSERRAADRSAAEAARISALRFSPTPSRRDSRRGVAFLRTAPEIECSRQSTARSPRRGRSRTCRSVRRPPLSVLLGTAGCGRADGRPGGEFLQALIGGRVKHIAGNYETFIARERVRLEASELYEALIWLAAAWGGPVTARTH